MSQNNTHSNCFVVEALLPVRNEIGSPGDLDSKFFCTGEHDPERYEKYKT